MTDIDLDALEAVAAASGAIATAPVLDLIARVRELEAIVNDGGNQAAKDYRRMREAEQACDRAKSAARTLGQILERQVEDTLRWAGMEDQIRTDDPDQQLAWELCAEMPGKIATLTAERDRYRAAIEEASRAWTDDSVSNTVAGVRAYQILSRALNENGGE